MNSERASDDILWAALGEQGNAIHRRAVVAAFAYIAAADGAAGLAELVTFQARVAASKVFSEDVAAEMWADYRELSKRLVHNDPTGLKDVEDRLSLINDDAGRAVVIAAARIAVVADGEDNAREEVAVAHIARLIGAAADEALLTT